MRKNSEEGQKNWAYLKKFFFFSWIYAEAKIKFDEKGKEKVNLLQSKSLVAIVWKNSPEI